MSEERAPADTGETEDLDLLDDELGLEPEPEEIEDEAPEAEPETEPEAEPPPRPVSREQRRIQALRQREKEAREETRRLREERDRLLTQSRVPPPQQPDPYRAAEEARLEAERVMLMPSHEQAAYYARKAQDQMQQQLLRSQLETRDLLDQQAFDALKRSRPAAARLASQVEQTLVNARNQGMNPTRTAIYHLLLGQEIDEKSQRQVENQRRNGERRIASQQTRPGTTRSTVAGSRQGGRRAPTEADDEALLKGLTLEQFDNL